MIADSDYGIKVRLSLRMAMGDEAVSSPFTRQHVLQNGTPKMTWDVIISSKNDVVVFLELQRAVPVQGQRRLRLATVLQPREQHSPLHVSIFCFVFSFDLVSAAMLQRFSLGFFFFFFASAERTTS